MMEALTQFDNRTAAGILARAAFSLEPLPNPAANPLVDGEMRVRSKVIDSARKQLGIDERNNEAEALDKIGDYLDKEAESLIGEFNTDASVRRLIEGGSLPSDLYDIQIIENIKTDLGPRFEKEKSLIVRTVREAQRQQHYGPGDKNDLSQPRMVSLFSRNFTTPYPFKDFILLVAGHRGDNKVLHIHQAWRLYQSQVDTTGAPDLVDLLKRFSDVYGYDITVGGQTGHFFFFGPLVKPGNIEIRDHGKPSSVSISSFAQVSPTGKPMSSLITAINLKKYHETLKKMDIEDIS